MPEAIAFALTYSWVAAGLTLTNEVLAATALAGNLLFATALTVGLSVLSGAFNKPPSPPPSDFQAIIKQAISFRRRHYGRVKVSGILVFAQEYGDDLQKFFARVIAIASGKIDAVEQHWIDDAPVSVVGGSVQTPPYSPYVLIDYRTGDPTQVAYQPLLDDLPDYWTTDHRGDGVAHAMIIMHKPVPGNTLESVFPRVAETQYLQTLRGARVFDPNDGTSDINDPDTWKWTDNAACILLDYLTHEDGLGLDKNWIVNALQQWQAAVSICQEGVELAGGGTEPRYRAAGTYTFNERPADVISRFLTACDGIFVPVQGAAGPGLALKVGQWEEPTVTLDDDAIQAFSEIGRGRDILTSANVIRAKFMSPENGFIETDADPWEDEDDVAVNGELGTDLDLMTVPSHSQARRLMKLAARRAAPDFTGTITTNLLGLTAIGERFIRVKISDLDIDDTFEILDSSMIVGDGATLLGMTFQVSTLRAEAYDWIPGFESGSAPGVPDPSTIDIALPVPTGLVPAVAIITVGGETGSVVDLAWADVDPTDGGSPPLATLTYQARGMRVGGTVWFSVPLTGTRAAETGFLERGSYQFQVRSKALTTGFFSEWSVLVDVTIP